MDKIISKTKYSRKEHKKFYLFHLTHRSASLYLIIGLIILLGALTINNVMKQQNMWFSIIMFGITCGILPYLFISKVNEVVKQETPERVKSTDTIEVTKHKITRSCDTVSGKATIGWNNLDSVCETDDYFYLYTTEQSGLFIKKTDIIEGDVESFRKLALDNLPVGKKGAVNYKRYGKVKKEYNIEMKAKKKAMKAKKKAEKNK